MSLRTGAFIKYVVEFEQPGLTGLTVSNDVLVGDVCIDADVSVKMSRWMAGATFEITLYDLPEPKVQSLADTLKAKPHLTIQLGYFDTKADLVLKGVYDSVDSKVAGDKLVTTVKGREVGFFACATTRFTSNVSGELSYAQTVEQILATAEFPADCLSTDPQTKDLSSDTRKKQVFNSKFILGVLDEIAQRANAELMIVDGKVFLGSPIRYDVPPLTPIELNGSTNLARFQPFTFKKDDKKGIEVPGDDTLNFPTPLPAADMIGFRFTMLGNPTLRPAQQIVVKGIKKYDSNANPEFRIRNVEHRFSATNGYTCIGVAARQLPDSKLARMLDAAADRSAASAVSSLSDSIRKQASENPVVEIGSVKDAADAYQANLYFGQPADGQETQASINVAVTQDDDHVYETKPIASAFAWRKCGLVTPVYAGMKALLVHNRAIASDGVVAGYIWSKQPDFPPPPNQAGDWWLCLPIDFDATKPPGDSTKAANDLTANDGRRVIELKGLKITVGADGLKAIGNRPTPGDAEVCTIAHASGPVITVKSGEIDVQMKADGSGPQLALTSSGMTLTDGTLKVQLANGKLAIG